MILDAKPVDAAKAVELGLIDEVIEGDLRGAALEYAQPTARPPGEVRGVPPS